MNRKIPIYREELIWYNCTEENYAEAKRLSLLMIDMQLQEGVLTKDLAKLLKEVWENEPEWSKDEESGKPIMIQRMSLEQLIKYKALFKFAELSGKFDNIIRIGELFEEGDEEKKPKIH